MAISDKLIYLVDTKAAIKTAIEGKGVSVPDGEPFRGYAALIESISGNGTDNEGSDGFKRVAQLNIYESLGVFTVTYEDGTAISGSATFDDNGNPTSLIDDNGNSVSFTSGYPVNATDRNGNTVAIVWG